MDEQGFGERFSESLRVVEDDDGNSRFRSVCGSEPGGDGFTVL